MFRLARAAVVALTVSTALAGDPDPKIDPFLAERLAGGARDSFLVLFDSSEGLERALGEARLGGGDGRAIYDVLRLRSRSTQAEARRWLEGLGLRFRPLWIVNGLQVEGDLPLARALASRDEVVRVVADPAVRGIDAFAGTDAGGTDGLEWGLLAIRADQVWNLDGARGAGITVASADTGVEWTHPAIRDRYRGWDGALASHDYHWHDAIVDAAAPIDDHNHGTHTVGTMVGDDGAGNQIGVAPEAKWIGCRNMDAGVGRPSTYLDCNQWFLAPWPHGGDPEIDGDPAMAPDVVNNSWGCPPSEGCDTAVLLDSFKALRAAGILAVVSAGNSGPSCSSVSDPPAIYDEGFAVGATESSGALALYSSRGNVTVDGSGRLRPDVAAPGSNVRSSVRGGGYASFSGTSMAGPHVAGAAALLWSAKPQVRGLLRITRCLMSRSASPAVSVSWPSTCGGTAKTVRPNNFFGWGRIDAYAAIHFGPDADADGIADACDCAAANGGAYDAPAEAGGIRFDTKSALAWDALAREAGNGTVYDLVRGDLADLRAAGSIAASICQGPATTAATRTDPATPAPEAGFYYLVQARNACGVGGWGAGRTRGTCP
ncbi:MAG TPA: S8 family serine peptidase [Candidatus Polarisedimenticolaceae bacterium]